MIDYQKMYFALMHGISDAIVCLEQQNYGVAKELLIKASYEAEDIYADSDEE